MSDVQKTIELLIQFKEAGQEIVQNADAVLKQLSATAEATGAEINRALSVPAAGQAQAKIGGVVSEVGVLTVALRATADEFKASQASAEAFAESATAGLNATAASAEGAAAALQQTQQATATSGQSFVQGLNSTLGRGSEIGGFLRLLAGSGPIIALTLLATKFHELAKTADELSIKLREGKITFPEFFEGLLLKLPIVGQISEGLIAIEDAITGVGYAEEVAAEKAKKSAEAWKEAARDIKGAADAVKEAHRQASEMIEKFNDQAALQKSDNPVQSAIDQQYADEASRRRDIYNTFDQRRKEAGVDRLPDLQQQLGNPLKNLGQIRAEIKTIQDAYASIAKDEEDAIQASDNLTDQAVAGIRQRAATAFAGDQIKKLAEEFKSSWDDAQKLVDSISRKIEAEDARLAQERSQLIKNAQTPQQKYDAGMLQLDQLQRYSPLPPGIYDQEKARLEKDLEDGNAAVAKALDERKLKQDEYNAAIAMGTTKQVADAQTAYDRDVAAWHEALLKKEITQEQFDQFVVERARQREEQLYQIQLQQRRAGQEVQLAGLAANHDGLGAQNLQIQMDYEAQAEQLRQEYQVQGLLSEQQYNDAIVGLDKSTAEKRLAINGNLVDGVKLGMEKMGDSIQSQAQMGERVTNDLAAGFGNAFGEIVTGTKTVGAAFRDMALSVLNDFAKMEAEAAIKTLLHGVFAGFTANSGGMVPGYAMGDIVAGPWGPDIDSVHAMLTPGEFVVRRSAVQQPGVLPMLRAINSGMGAFDVSRSAAASLGRSSSASHAGTSGGLPSVALAAIVSTDAQVSALFKGGRNGAIDWLRANFHHYAPRGGK